MFWPASCTNNARDASFTLLSLSGLIHSAQWLRGVSPNITPPSSVRPVLVNAEIRRFMTVMTLKESGAANALAML
ncbi:hypothetical protein D3C71_2024730 [compost metagenome]